MAPRLQGTGWHHLREDSYPFRVDGVRLCERVPLSGRPHARPWPLALLPVTQLQREGLDDDEGALQPPLQLCPWQGLQLLPGTAGDKERGLGQGQHSQVPQPHPEGHVLILTARAGSLFLQHCPWHRGGSPWMCSCSCPTRPEVS